MNRLNQLRRLCLTLCAAIVLAACATSPYSKDIKARSDALLAQQIEAARAGMAQDTAPRLLFAGVAMNDQTTAFRNDVLLAESVARKVDPKAIVFKLVNPVPGQDADLPYATRENIANVLQKLAELARPQDKVMVLLSSHGADGSIRTGGQTALGHCVCCRRGPLAGAAGRQAHTARHFGLPLGVIH